MTKTFAKAVALAGLVASFGFAATASAAAPLWDVSGSYVVAFDYLGSDYDHDVVLSQDGAGNVTGSGGHPAGGPHVYTWVVTSGSVSGSTLEFYADYTASADAVTPLTTMHVVAEIDSNGELSGTWTDNYQGGSRAGTLESVSGAATLLPVGPTSKDQCKKDGWKSFTNPAFKNQGQCVSSYEKSH